MSNRTTLNFVLLSKALEQAGPWKDQNLRVTPEWFLQELNIKIKSIDWGEIKKDIARFLRPRELVALEVWSQEFFLSQAAKLAGYLGANNN